MRRNLIETLVGAVVIAVAAIFLVFAYDNADLRAVDGYRVMARFDRIDGLRTGSDVVMSGIKIGSVTGRPLDPETYLAVVTMTIDPKIELPADTSAAIVSDGLLGDKYLSLTPGAEDDAIPDGGEIEITQGAIDLLSLLGREIFSRAAQGAPGAQDRRD